MKNIIDQEKINLSSFLFLLRINLIAKIKIINLIKPIDLEREFSIFILRSMFIIKVAHRNNKDIKTLFF